MAQGFLQGLLGGRECTTDVFGDKQSPHQDVSAVCHDLRCLDLAPGEQAYISVRDVRRREGEAFAQLNSVVNLRTLELDTTLLLRVWVDEGPGNSGRHGERRVVGEVRMPLRQLIHKYSACLYHTWIALESPGLNDSVASLGLSNTDEGSCFDSAVDRGAKQINQPKACISVCRTANIGPSGRVIWKDDLPPEQRVAGWGPLLLSQQQHEVLCNLQHQKQRQASAPSNGYGGGQNANSQELQNQLRSQADEINRLKRELDDAQGQLLRGPPQDSAFSTQPIVGGPTAAQQAGAIGTGGMSATQPRAGPGDPGSQQRIADLEQCLRETESRERTAEQRLRQALTEAEDARLAEKQSKESLETVQNEVDKISQEANQKIEAANDRIRTLRVQREKAEQDLKSRAASHEAEVAALKNDNQVLQEQKEGLMRIVEDLHKACEGAGLTTGRESIDQITRTLGTQELRSAFD